MAEAAALVNVTAADCPMEGRGTGLRVSLDRELREKQDRCLGETFLGDTAMLISRDNSASNPFLPASSSTAT